ncbi:hypothetical protein J4466_04890 [Candidatus Pacearchaeota archaeon]|nr:hypothetical protein [Candidatus Pacearchaeota archaeon]
MKIEFLRDIAAMVAGKNAGQIVDLLSDKKNVNEFIIAKKLGLTINQARNILYKLSDEGLVSFIRKKDRKKGWYTYFWTFNTDKALILLQKHISKEIEQLEYQLKSREQKRFYICKTCNTEVTEETALLHNFICPECGEVYELNDNKKAISEINSSINRLRRQLEEINKEVRIIEDKKTKKMESDRKKIEKEKLEKRRKSQLERKKARDKLAKPKIKKFKKSSKKKKKVSKKIKKNKPFKNKRLPKTTFVKVAKQKAEKRKKKKF